MDSHPHNPTLEAYAGRLAQHWLTGNLLLALAYFLTGQAGLLLATAPGFATPVWPGAGIALGWVLLFGPRLLPGVVLGSFAVNLTLGMRTADAGPFEVNWLIPLLIALGAGAQALAGSTLIRRHVRFPTGFEEPRAVIRTLVLGGMVATLLNASWSVTMLVLAGAVDTGRWLQNWFTWWVGDSIGVLVFTPLLLVWGLSRPYYDRTRALIVTAVLAGTFTAAVLGFLVVQKLEQQDRVGRFQAASKLAVSQIQRRFADYDEFSRLTRSLFDSSASVTRAEFWTFVHEWQANHPEVLSVQWAPRIVAADRPAFEAGLGRDLGRPGTILDRAGPGQLVPAGQRPVYVPLAYIEPQAPSQALIGYDAYADLPRRQAMQAALAQGVPLMSPPLQLIQDTRRHPGALLYTAVYDTPTAPVRDWDHVRGFVVLVLKADELLARLSRGLVPAGLTLQASDPRTGETLYGSAPRTPVESEARKFGLHHEALTRLGQREWRIEVWPTDGYLDSQESWLTWLVLVVGLGGTSIAVSFTLLSSGRRQYLERIIADRTNELLERNGELDAARVEAVQANASKGQFLANMSHEIRTPMNAIIGFSHLLMASPLASQERDYLEKIDSSARALLNIINDILDFSKIEAGRIDIEHEPFILDEVLQRVAQQVTLVSAEKRLEFVFDLPPDLPRQLVGDALRLGQVLLNLCNNAVKFTDRGTVVVRVEALAAPATPADGEDRIRLRFSVRDTGIGISPEQLDRLFNAFSQADGSITRRYGGTGLGLVVSQSLVELMGGDIEVESKPGVGSTFAFTLDFGLRSRQPSVPAPAAASGLKVLVVDDAQVLREVMVRMLAALGHQAVAVASADEAVTWLRTADAAQPFDLVLLDWKMPCADGVETAHRIYHLPLSRLPALFMITGYGHTRVRQLSDGGLFAAYLHKPVTPAALQQTISAYFNPQPSSTLPTESWPTLRFAPARVLLVEDNPLNQKLGSEMLSRLGLSVDVVANGTKALEQLNAPDNHYDLVLMDLQMPVMDGFETTSRIRERFDALTLPVIAMTAYAMPAERQHCLDAGMNGHLAKPIDPVLLEATLAQYLPLAAQALVAPPVVSTLLDATALREGLVRLNQLLRRNSLDARLAFAEVQASLQQHYPDQAGEMALALSRLHFRAARQCLDKVARAMEISLD